MRALIIGVDGFVGGYLKNELINNGYEVFGTTLEGVSKDSVKLDILNKEEVKKVVENILPDVVFHMAGQADVGLSWKKPDFTINLNVIGTINLLEAAKNICHNIKILIIGSSDQYGKLSGENAYVSEEVPLVPSTPYAISKCAQEQMALLYAKTYNMNIYLTRSFNHMGVGQKKGFVIPDIASGIADIEKGFSDRLLVGNLSAQRDFTDVRDIVRAYRLIIELGQNNTVYNVGSGNAYCIEDLVKKMISMSKCKITIQRDQSKMRKLDTPFIKCNCTKLVKDTNWNAQYNINDTLFEVLESFRRWC